jgi:gluconate:H+ symporter, GntP family
MPYVGFDLPLLLVTFPLAIVTALYFRCRYVRGIPIDKVLEKMAPSRYPQHGMKMFLPLVVVIGLMVAVRIVPQWVPDLGIPLIFLLGVLAAFGTGEKFPILDISRKALREALPVMCILVGVGMFVQIMTLTGVRGCLALGALRLPPELLYVGIALIMPAFGSAYAAASVIGVPLVFVFLGRNEIVVAAALSLIAGVGDLMPPPSLLCVFSAQIVGVKNHFQILRESALPIIASLLVGILLIIFAGPIGSFCR